MMTAEQLSASILKLAMQGKLVDQRPEEGTGKSVYLKLKQEQKKLIASGRIKEKNVLGEIEVEEIEYDLPDTWAWARIEECGYFISGYTPQKSQLCNNGIIPYFKVSDMNTPGNETYLSFTEQYLSPEINQPRVFEKGTIVYPKNGGAVFTNKKRILAQPSVVDLNTGGYKPSENIDPDYAFLLYSTIDFRQCYKGTALPTIDMEKLRRKLFPIPPLAEQTRIVAKIEELMPLVEQYAEASTKLNTLNATFPDMMKKSILQEAVQGKLVPQDPNDEPASELLKRIAEEKQRLIKEGKIKKQKALPEITEDEIPFDIPDSWEWLRITDLVSISSGNKYEEVDSGSLYIKVAEMNLPGNEEEITLSDKYVSEDNKGIIPVFSIIFPKRGGAIATNKKRNVLKQPIYIDSNTMAMTVLYPSVFPYIRKWFDAIDLAKLQSGSAIPQVNNQDIEPLLVPLPPLEEQKRIVARIDELMPVLDKLVKQ